MTSESLFELLDFHAYESARPHRAPAHMPNFDALLALGWFISCELMSFGAGEHHSTARKRWRNLYSDYLMKENSSQRFDSDRDLVALDSDYLFPDYVFLYVFAQMPTTDAPFGLDKYYSEDLRRLYRNAPQGEIRLLEALMLFYHLYGPAISEFKNGRSRTRKLFELVRVKQDFERTKWNPFQDHRENHDMLSPSERSSIEYVIKGMKSQVAGTRSVYDNRSDEVEGALTVLYGLGDILEEEDELCVEGTQPLFSSALSVNNHTDQSVMDDTIPEICGELLSMASTFLAESNCDLEAVLKHVNKWSIGLRANAGAPGTRSYAWRKPRVQLVRAFERRIEDSATKATSRQCTEG